MSIVRRQSCSPSLCRSPFLLGSSLHSEKVSSGAIKRKHDAAPLAATNKRMADISVGTYSSAMTSGGDHLWTMLTLRQRGTTVEENTMTSFIINARAHM